MNPADESGPSSHPSSLLKQFWMLDGAIVPSDSECKQGMDFAYDRQYGYHPLLIHTGRFKTSQLWALIGSSKPATPFG